MLGQEGCLQLALWPVFSCESGPESILHVEEVSINASPRSGNLDLPPYLPFLGNSQLQILSFVTSAILLTCHIFTSWAVTERVLLRDE